jgi:hypothetical protein
LIICAAKRCFQQLQIGFLANLGRPQTAQMIGHKLAVEQAIATQFHPRDQPRKRHF